MKGNRKISRTSFVRLLGLFFRNRKNAVLMIVCVAVAGFAAAMGPRMLGNATNALTGSSSEGLTFDPDWGVFYRWIWISLITYLIQFVTKFVSGRLSAVSSSQVAYELRKEMEEKLWKLPLKYYDDNANGDILSRFSNDIDNVVTSLNQTGSDSVFYIIQLLVTIFMMFTISPALALITFVVLPLSLAAVYRINLKMKPALDKQMEYTGIINADVDESINGHTVIKSYGLEEGFFDEFEEKNKELYDTSCRAMKFSNMIQPLSRMITNMNFCIAAGFGAIKVITGQMDLGDLQAFIQYVRRYQTPFSMLAQSYATLQTAIASLDRIYDFLEAEEERPDKETAEDEYMMKGKLEFKDVAFSYLPDQKLIENMNLSVEPGQMVAIVGGTGAGKTTLVNLIERFYEIGSGSIMIDGKHEIHDITRSALRKNIAMVLQDTWVYKGSIRENLLYGAGDAEVSQKEFEDACAATFVDTFVSKLPEGYDTVIQNEFCCLSAGEKQLLTICRAFLSKPNILILDEATSSVDTRTEVMIQSALDALRQGRTSFVIAHRLSTIRNADVILVMEKGHIVEQGSHDELLKQNGQYAALYRAAYSGA